MKVDKSFVDNDILRHEMLRDIRHLINEMKSMVNFLKFWMVELLKTLRTISNMNINIYQIQLKRSLSFCLYPTVLMNSNKKF